MSSILCNPLFNPHVQHQPMLSQTLSHIPSSCQALGATRGTRRSADISRRSRSFPKPILQPFSLVNPMLEEENCHLFYIFLSSPLLSWSCIKNERKTFGSVFHATTGANIRDKDKEFIQSHALLASCLFFITTIFKTKIQKPFEPIPRLPCLTAVRGQGWKWCVRVCALFMCLLYTHGWSVVRVCLLVWSTDIVRWGGLDVVFQSE